MGGFPHVASKFQKKKFFSGMCQVLLMNVIANLPTKIIKMAKQNILILLASLGYKLF